MGDAHGTDSEMVGMSGHGITTAASGHSVAMTAALDEQSFLEQMVPHHESAIAMAELALQKATHPQVRRLARNIISSQKSEITEMTSRHRTLFGAPLVPDTAAMHGMDMGALETATDGEFDRAFLSMMIPHHASAIVMADAVKMGEPHQDVAMLADEIISAQAKEIGQMQQWREQWYPPLG